MSNKRQWLSGLVAALFAALLVVASAPASAWAAGFSDVKSTDWFAGAADWSDKNFIIQGYGNGTFGGDDECSRAQVAVILYRVFGDADSHVDAAAGKTDVEQGVWYSDAVDWALDKGIMNGYGGTTLFGPNDTITREQAVTALANAARNIKNVATPSTDTAKFDQYGDTATVDGWAKNDMVWAANNGIIGNGGYLGGTDDINRAQMATILQNALTKNVVPVATETVTAAATGQDASGNPEVWAPEKSYTFQAENIRANELTERFLKDSDGITYQSTWYDSPSTGRHWGLDSITKDGRTLATVSGDHSYLYWNVSNKGESLPVYASGYQLHDGDAITWDYQSMTW